MSYDNGFSSQDMCVFPSNLKLYYSRRPCTTAQSNVLLVSSKKKKKRKYNYFVAKIYAICILAFYLKKIKV